MALPEEFCRRKKIKPGTALRVTETGNGLYVSLVPEPTARELRDVIAEAGSLHRSQTPADEELLRNTIALYRAEKRRK